MDSAKEIRQLKRDLKIAKDWALTGKLTKYIKEPKKAVKTKRKTKQDKVNEQIYQMMYVLTYGVPATRCNEMGKLMKELGVLVYGCEVSHTGAQG